MVVKSVNSLKLKLHLDDWIQQNLFFLNSYETTELKFLKNNLKSDSTFIDIGANIGLFSLTASNIIKNGKIVSFEPFSKNLDTFQTNISLNNKKNIKIEKIAIGAENGEINLYYNEKEQNLGMVSIHKTKDSNAEKTKLQTLDSYVENNAIQNIDFIKIDIEGNEFSALQGMASVLKKQNPVLLIEILTQKEKDLIVPFLEKLGYQKYYLYDNAELSSENKNPKRLNYVFIKK